MSDLAPDEARAIRSLERLAAKWPRTLTLFSAAGSLVVIRSERDEGPLRPLAYIDGIPNDGGDPGIEPEESVQ